MTTVGRRPGTDGRTAARTTLRLLTTVVKAITMLFAFVLVAHIVLAVAHANPANNITIFFARWADQLTLGVGDLFVPASEPLRILANYGLAAVLWLVIGIVVTKLLRALMP